MKHWPERFQCEVCHNYYDTPDEAIACEAKMPPQYPVGMIYGNANAESHHARDMTFAIAKVRHDRHWNDSPSWACRDTGVGDSLGKEVCKGGGFTAMTADDAPAKDHPTFLRMVEWLQSRDILVTVWDGYKVVTLRDYLEA